VTFVFSNRQTTEVIEANGLLSEALGNPPTPAALVSTVFDYDDYGNSILTREFGLDDPGADDERVTTTTYARGGNALSLWIINQPDTVSVTDEHGAFVSRKVHFYDGEPFVGLQGQIQNRALLHRTVEYADANVGIPKSRSRFDAFGNIVEAQDPRGNIRRMSFDPDFHIYPVAEILVVGGGNPDLVFEADYDLGFGVVTQTRDFNGHTARYLYDGFARLVKTVYPGDSLDWPTVVYEYQPCDPIRGRAFQYDASGNLTLAAVPRGSISRVTTRQRQVAGQPDEYVTASFADGSGKGLATIEEAEDAGVWVVKQASSYNLRGQAQSQWLPYRITSLETPQFPQLWPAGRPPATDGTNLVVATDNYYDPLGRQLRAVAPPESWGGPRRETVTHYVPFQNWVFDEEDLLPGSPHAGTPHVSSTDGLGRVVAVIEVVKLDDSGQPVPNTNHWVTHYQYDLNDQLTRVTDSQNNSKILHYDGLRRKTYVNDPDQGATTYLYDDASNLIETTDAKGQRITYTYDGVNRILTEDYHDENSAEFSYQRSPDVKYFYDEPAASVDFGDGTKGTARNTRSMLAYVQDASGEEHTSYDERGRVEWTVKRIPDPGTGLPLTPLPSALVAYTTRFDYDSLGRVTRIRYPDNDEVTYVYNSRNLLRQIVGGPSGNIISSISYNAAGQQQRVDYGNGVRTTYNYDPRLRMTDLLTVSQPATLNRELINFHYEFDSVSNIRSIVDRRSTTTLPSTDARRNTQAFTYDNVYRLTGVQYNAPAAASANGGSIHYRYDRVGNLLAQTSDLAQFERGVPVTDLGLMSYGGAAGPANREGRQAGDPPGPHALSGIEHPVSGARSFPYDAKGNMLEIDGLHCTWDFKDRLVEVEDDTMRAEYRYDYTDRRIIKRVWPKTASEAPPPPLSLPTQILSPPDEVIDSMSAAASASEPANSLP
jgi:YD repeat-containing protein